MVRKFIVDSYTAIFYLEGEKDELEWLLRRLRELDKESLVNYARWKTKQGKRVPSFLIQQKWENAKLEEIKRNYIERWYREILGYETVISVGGGGKGLIEKMRLSSSQKGKEIAETLYCPIKRVVKNGKTVRFIDKITNKPYEGQVYRVILNEYERVENIGDAEIIAIVDDVVNSGATIREIAKWMGALYNTKDIVCFVALDLRKKEQQLPCEVVSIYRVKENNRGSAYLATDLIEEFRDLQDFLKDG